MNGFYMHLRRLQTWPLFLLLVAVLPVPAGGAESQFETIRVTADRPLYSFSLELQKRSPIAVTYEEPAPDVAPFAAAAREPAGSPSSPASLIVRYRVSAATGMPEDPAALLEEAITAHQSAGSSVRFKLIEDEKMYHIVPMEARNLQGRWVKIVPLFDARITLPEAEREVGQTLIAIREALHQATGQEILLGEVPVNWVTSHYVRLGGKAQTVRQLLDEALAGGRFTWQLLYDARLRGYVLRIQPLAAPRQG